MRLQRVCPAENRIEPWRQRATCAREQVGGDVDVSGKGKRCFGRQAWPRSTAHGSTTRLREKGTRWSSYTRGSRTAGCGKTNSWPSPTAMVEGPFSYHEDLRALLDSLNVERAHLVSCSMGGGTVLDFALEYPQRVGNLVLVGSAVGGFGPEIDPPRQWDEILAAEEAGDLERVSELEVQVWVDGPGRSPDDVDASVRDLVREMNLIALRNEASGLGDEWEPEPPAADRLPDVQAPTLLVVGDEDQPSVFAAADLLERELPNVRKVVMHGTAHVPNMERPEEFNRIVLDFLRDHS